jgi:hypothetical protein
MSFVLHEVSHLLTHRNCKPNSISNLRITTRDELDAHVHFGANSSTSIVLLVLVLPLVLLVLVVLVVIIVVVHPKV